RLRLWREAALVLRHAPFARAPMRLLWVPGFLGHAADVSRSGAASKWPNGRRFKEQTAGLHGFLPSAPLRNVMAANLATNYETALDDITRRGVSAIRSTHQKVDSAISNTADAARSAVDGMEKVQNS